MKLDAVNYSNKPSHYFTYHSGSIKQRHTMDRDFLGYQTSSRADHLVGLNNQLAEPFGDSRAPSLSESKVGVLKKIQYPTGGFTSFEFELNKADVGSGVIEEIGGLRIKKIISKPDDGSSEALIREYEYGTGNIPSYLRQVVKFGYYTTEEKTYTYESNECTTILGTSEATTPLFGHFVIYEEVTEIIDEGNGGEVVESYYQHGGGYFDGEFVKAVPQVKKIKNNQNEILRKSITEYNHGTVTVPDSMGGNSVNPNQISSIRWLRPDIKITPGEVDPLQADTAFDNNSGYYQTQWVHPTQKIIDAYDPNSPSDTLRTIEQFTYDDPTHKQVTELERINSTGNWSRKLFYYAHDSYTDMRLKFMIRQPYSIILEDSTWAPIRKRWLLWSDTNGTGKWHLESEWVWKN